MILQGGKLNLVAVVHQNLVYPQVTVFCVIPGTCVLLDCKPKKSIIKIGDHLKFGQESCMPT